MDRRDFIKFISVLGIGFMLPHSTLTAKEIEKVLENEDREGFYIRFYKPFKPVDPDRWTLKVGGLCENPKAFNLSDIKRLRKDTQVSRMKCVESWSSKAKWGGFRSKTLFDIVKPGKEAKFVYFYSADDYYEYISIDDLLKQRVIFVYEMNDKLLPDIHGGPLRLIMPFKYGYKSVKTIISLDFVKEEGTGLWSKYGYSRDATIKTGEDHALDLGEYRTLKKEGEPDY
ncbi:MAG: molybdopterin-dependent oxidoreductase [Proteobacteria bacterium]|nr:molybdopterin-dependent oxidoreductase [Pseudomonadota bacterium]